VYILKLFIEAYMNMQKNRQDFLSEIRIHDEWFCCLQGLRAMDVFAVLFQGA